MTKEEAVRLVRELGEFVQEELPCHGLYREMLSRLGDVISELPEDDPGSPMVLGNLETLEMRPVDSRDWRRWGVEWIEDRKQEDTLQVDEEERR